MTKKNYFLTTLTIALPLTMTQILNSLSGFIGNVMLSHLGHDVLAASALLSSTQMMVTLIFASPFFSLGVMIARASSRGDTKEVGNLMQQSWIFALLLSLGPVFIYWKIYPILLFFGQDPHLAVLVVPYFHWAMIGMPLMMLNVTCSQLCFSTGRQVIMTIIMAAQVFVLITTAYIFIFGHLGFASRGVAGLGIAFDCAAMTQFILVTHVLMHLHEFKHFHLFKLHMRNGWAHLKQMVVVGWPITVQVTGEFLSYSFVTYMVGWLGRVPLAASQITSQFIMLMVIPAFGFSSAASILIGRAMGSKQYHEIEKIGHASLVMSLSVIVGLSMLILLFQHQLIHWFILPDQANYEATVSLVKPLFLIGLGAVFFDTIRNTLTGALRGLFDSRMAMLVALLSLWGIRIPLSYLLGFYGHLGVIGVSCSGLIAFFIGSLLLLRHWRRKIKIGVSHSV